MADWLDILRDGEGDGGRNRNRVGELEMERAIKGERESEIGLE